MPTLTLIIVNFNGRRVLEECLESIARCLGGADWARTVVVDNASSDGSAAMVRERFAWAEVIEAGGNVGFAAGNNLALRRVRTDYALLLNSDTELRPGAVEALVEFAEGRPDAGSVGARLLYADGTVQGSAKSFPNPMNALFGRQTLLSRLWPTNPITRRYLPALHVAADGPFPVDYVSGAALLIPRRVLETVGVLDERFWMYWEDADWGKRVWAAGLKVYYHPGAVIVHKEGKSSGREPVRLVWEFHKSVYRYYDKHVLGGPLDPRRPLAAALLGLRAALLALRSAALRRLPARAAS